MAAFAKRARLTSQPQYAAGLDWSNPLARGVVEVYNAAAPQRIAGGYGAATPSGTGYRASSATSGGVVLPAVSRDSAAGTVLFIALGSTADGYYWDGETGSNRDLFYRGFTSPDVGGYGWYVNSTLIADNSNSAIASTFLDNGVCALRWTSSAQSAWKNGAQVQSWSRTIGASASTRAVRLGSRFNSTEGLTSGGLVLRVEWSRALSDDEIAKVTADPWQLFAPRRIWVPVAGAGPVTHATTGALANAGATLAGSAAVVRVHATSGTLANAGAVIAASASRTRAHPTSGVLANAGAAVVGSAARAGGATTHDTTGALATSGALVVGLAARVAIHATTGALVAGGAFIAGSAARVGAPVTHATSGSLAGQGAIIVGVAAGPFVPSGDQALAVPRFGLRVKTGELFALVLDAGNVPIAYRRSNGGLVSIRLINTTTRSAAINDQGDIIQII